MNCTASLLCEAAFGNRKERDRRIERERERERERAGEIIAGMAACVRGLAWLGREVEPCEF